MVDPILVGIVALMVGFVFFVYLMIRRTAQQFKQGVDGGKRRGG